MNQKLQGIKMEELEKDIIRKFMKKTSNEVRNCLHKVFVKQHPKTIEQLLVLAKKCLADKGGMSDSDYRKVISELENVIKSVKKELKELNDLLNSALEEQEQEQKVSYKPRDTPKR